MRKSKTTNISQDKDMRQSLLSSSSVNRELTVDKEELCDLFHPDNIKNLQKDHPISLSLYKYHHDFKGAAQLAASLNSNIKTGIDGDSRDIKSRVKKYGANYKRPPKIKTLLELILENFEDRILQILLIAATVALIVGVVQHGAEGAIEGLSIFIAVIIIVSVTAGNNYIKEKQFQKLVSKAAEQDIAVFRGGNGNTQTVPIQNLVVGDVIKIEAGMSIPADCVLIDGTDIQCDEAAMTGEPDQVEKQGLNAENVEHNPNPFLLAKTLVCQGQGVALVCAVGVNTRSGMAEEKLNIEEEETPLQAKLETIADQIGKVGVYVSALTFIAMTINLLISAFLFKNIELISLHTLGKLVDFLIISITIIVVAVPEGLPLAVTISLAFSVMKMKKENNLVRKLEASETMGGASEICTDKTGTLTKNQMTVMEYYTLQNFYNAETQKTGFKSLSTHQLLTEGILYNCSARIELVEGKYETKGNCTEQGLLKFVMQQGVNAFEDIRKKDENTLEVIPFNSKRKRASTVIRCPDDQDKVRVFLKGAPEIVMQFCGKVIDSNGHATELTEEKKKDIMHQVVAENFAKKAYRTILIAYDELSFEEYKNIKHQNNNFAKEEDREVLEKNMTVIGILALMDPLRDEIVQSVIHCNNAGINIRMVTGDNLDTARAIALNAGILKQEDLKNEYACMEGKTFRELCGGLKKISDDSEGGKLKEVVGNKNQFRQVIKQLKVLARSTPEDKYMLVTGLRDEGQVVAVTGDGTNDAPALKKADVGFAMGITGTEVAKEASDIILLDDNFASIITAVKWGRNIYTNVRKFLQFQLTVNCVAMFIVFLGGVALSEPPLTSVQMLWVNLIMDTLAALALATEPPSNELLLQKPYARNDQIVTATMWRNIVGQGLYQATILIVMLFAGDSIFGLPQQYYLNDKGVATEPGYWWPEIKSADGTVLNGSIYPAEDLASNKCILYTMIFQTFVFLQVFNEINSRKLGVFEYNVFKGFFNNLLFLAIIVFTIGVQCLMVEYGGKAVRTSGLTTTQHIICLVIGMFSLVQGLIVKLALPVKWFEKLQMKEEAMTEEEIKKAFTTTFRKSFRASHRMSAVRDAAVAQEGGFTKQ